MVCWLTIYYVLRCLNFVETAVQSVSILIAYNRAISPECSVITLISQLFCETSTISRAGKRNSQGMNTIEMLVQCRNVGIVGKVYRDGFSLRW